MLCTQEYKAHFTVEIVEILSIRIGDIFFTF